MIEYKNNFLCVPLESIHEGLERKHYEMKMLFAESSVTLRFIILNSKIKLKKTKRF